MRFYLLLILVPAASFACSSLLAAVATGAGWPLAKQRLRHAGASARARAIGVMRLAPVATGALIGTLVTATFIRFEPRDTTEMPGLLLGVAGAVALVLTMDASVRVARAILAAARCSRLIRLGGTKASSADGTSFWVLDTDYPVAAVTGIFRTRLLLSTRILRECSAEELETIISHERAHVRRRDNLVRAAMFCLPDPLRFTRAGREMEHAWASAAEEAADDAAAGETDERRALLASALVRVAKMATAPMPEWMPGLAFYEGNNLETRVRRLLGAARLSPGARVQNVVALASLCAVCVLALTETAASELHAWMELAVRFVP
jgi:Zn-dependent protease with chaperone function